MMRVISRSAVLAAALCFFLIPPALAADIESAQRLAAAGKYEQALEEATTALEGNVYYDRWHLLKAEMELTLGRWSDARATIEQGLTRHRSSIQLRWLGREAFRRSGDDAMADRMIREILVLTEGAPRDYLGAENLVVLGQVALEIGIDPKDVLKAFFERAQKSSAVSRAPALAMGRLALEKHDFKLAATTYRNALERFPDDPDFLFGLAVAIADSDRDESAKLLQRAITTNPRHLPSLLLIADRQIDAEKYDDAVKTLEQVLAINPQHDEAHAFLAAIAHLRSDSAGETSHREQALASWSKNPRVDFLIGRELSQKYRFEEGFAAQERSLALNAKYLPARRQAAEDLLRLGRVEEGWALADEVFRDNQYDVAAYNLVTLRDEMQGFATLEDDSFILRMDAQEAEIYGERVLALLNRAKSQLCEKYGLQLSDKVRVEIFPDPADFEVRTFGMPGIPGFLGVCFGKVITANSPASQGANPNSWEAVLWHEFCHVVTLQLTRNRMPRWLSEGISVYEERQADSRWGQPMTPRERQRIVDGKLTPIRDLSSAFLNPDGPGGIQFAYFQSSLVVEYLIDAYGLEALKAVMTDLAGGVPINEALPRHTADMEQLEAEFIQFAQSRAADLAPDVDWSPADLAGILVDDDAEALLRDWVSEHPHNWEGLTAFADLLVKQEKWDEARQILERMYQIFPDNRGPESPLLKLAAIARRQGDVDAERKALEQYATLDADAVEAFLRLIGIARDRGDVEALERNGLRLMGVNPLTPHPHRALAAVADERKAHQDAIAAYRSLLLLKPDDPSVIHFRLAEHLTAEEDAESARQHVLQALENAPRYRDAQRLLLELTRAESDSPAEKSETAPSSATK